MKFGKYTVTFYMSEVWIREEGNPEESVIDFSPLICFVVCAAGLFLKVKGVS